MNKSTVLRLGAVELETGSLQFPISAHLCPNSSTGCSEKTNVFTSRSPQYRMSKELQIKFDAHGAHFADKLSIAYGVRSSLIRNT